MQKRYEKDAVGYVPPPKPTKSGKRLAKDPERPKKAKTAYLFYADQARPSISKANPGLSVTVSLSQKLNKYTTNLAALSLSLARGEARSRAAYDELPVTRIPPPPPSVSLSVSLSPTLPLSHSHSLTLHRCFGSPQSIAPLLAAGWKKLSDSQRAKFTSLAEKDKGRFAKEMESYEPSEAYVAAREQFNALQKAQKAAKLSKVPAGAANPGEFTSLQEENAKLRAALEQERRKSSEHIKLLQAFHAKEAEKGDKEAEELAYSKFVKKAWGDMGEKADKALKIVYAEHGHQGVVEELATRFREKELPKVKAKLEVLAKKRNKEAAKLDLAASASAVDAEGAPVKRGRGRPIGAKSKPKEPGSTPKKAAKPAAKKKATSPAPSEPRSKRAKK